MQLANTVAIITGAGRGIGRGITLAFARQGADVAIADKDSSGLETLSREVHELGRRVLALPTDVSRTDEVQRLVAQTKDELGPIDVLVNNAGTIVLPGSVLETTPEAWDTMMAVNARGVFLCTQAVLPGMIERRGGKVITIASTAGLQPLPNRAGYCASKHAVVGFVKCAALEMKPYGIAVNAICPGAVNTPLTAYSRPDADKTAWLKPADIADVAVFLASDAARGMTGAIVEVGGWDG